MGKIRGKQARLLRLATTLLGQDRQHLFLRRLQLARQRFPPQVFSSRIAAISASDSLFVSISGGRSKPASSR
jgi:hypothetical protein